MDRRWTAIYQRISPLGAGSGIPDNAIGISDCRMFGDSQRHRNRCYTELFRLTAIPITAFTFLVGESTLVLCAAHSSGLGSRT